MRKVSWKLYCLLSFIVVTVATSGCNKRMVRYHLSHPGCIPVLRSAYGCRGTCSSYSLISAEDPFQMQRSCKCCEAIEERFVGVRLRCPRLDKPFKNVYAKSAIECLCRPCGQISEYSEIKAP
ncbi:bursicon-like [Saccoglossus kowalevskii]|uniref:Bursicon-like n=1 Tax=Saccoglossus kowalevskii TaxID=10224 RepID=A0ABM0M257_SACKO|nr:PREDICTED: bursicon-like [Saccoglossus kowalevskii]